MRECPVCGVPLARVRYENFPLHRCATCHGVLVEHGRLEQIRRRMDTGIAELGREVEAEGAPGTAREIRCPKCHCPMEKQRAFERDRARFSAGIEAFGVDVCTQCDVTWLDGGELARIQLNYELSPAGIENRRHYVRYSDLDPQEREAFLRAMAESVPDSAASIASAFAAGIAIAAQPAARNIILSSLDGR